MPGASSHLARRPAAAVLDHCHRHCHHHRQGRLAVLPHLHHRGCLPRRRRAATRPCALAGSHQALGRPCLALETSLCMGAPIDEYGRSEQRTGAQGRSLWGACVWRERESVAGPRRAVLPVRGSWLHRAASPPTNAEQRARGVCPNNAPVDCIQKCFWSQYKHDLGVIGMRASIVHCRKEDWEIAYQRSPSSLQRSERI